MKLFNLFTFALRRLINQRLLALCLLIGLIAAAAFASAVPSYVDIAQGRVLQQRLQLLGVKANGGRGATEPFAVKYNHLSLGRDFIDQAGYQKLDDFVTSRRDWFVLPSLDVGRYASSDRYRVYASGDTKSLYTANDASKPTLLDPRPIQNELMYVSFDWLQNIESHVKLDEGEFPKLAAEGQPIEVMVERRLSNENGIRAGDTFTVIITEKTTVAVDLKTTKEINIEHPVAVKVTAVWRAIDERDSFWLVIPLGFREVFAVNKETFFQRVIPKSPEDIRMALWQVDLDEREFNVSKVDDLLYYANLVKTQAHELNGSFDLESRMLIALDRFRKTADELTLLLVIFGLPSFVMVLYFIALVGGMVVRQQESEIAMLRSRGATTLDVIILYVFQGLILGGVAVALGVPLGGLFAALIANTRSFLDFGLSADLLANVRWSQNSLKLATGAVSVGLVATIVPAVGAASRNIISYSANRNRGNMQPFWQRAYLDFLLLIPCAYGYWQLRNSGRLGLVDLTGEAIGTTALGNADPFSDPVRFLLPALFITAVGLVVARIVPWVCGLLARLLGSLDVGSRLITPLFLALRELARSAQEYLGPLVLLIFTLGIAVYGASTAKTLNDHLAETAYYGVGADARLEERGESNKPSAADQSFQRTPTTPEQDAEPELWTFKPVEEHLQIPGVQGVARVAFMDGLPKTLRGGNTDRAHLLAIDRPNYQQVGISAFRSDFAGGESFGGLMNDLGSAPNALLIQRQFATENTLKVGDKLAIEFLIDRAKVPITFTINGIFDNFPMYTPDLVDLKKRNLREFPFVANIGYVFESIGKEVPYDVLFKLAPNFTGFDLAREASDREFVVWSIYDARLKIRDEQLRPERQGLLGMLSAGFLLVTALTLVGFAVYTVLSFRRRSVEIGVLRALGLGSGQMAVYVILLQVLIVGAGAGAGVGLGVVVSQLFIPFLQVGGSLIADVPSFLPKIAWDEITLAYIGLGLALFIALAGTLWFLRRLRAFEAIKLGMTV